MREFLKGLGLDQETIDTIMAEHGKLMTANTEQLETQKKEIQSYKNQLKEFEGVNVKELNDQLATLKSEKEKLKTDHEAALNSLMLENALGLAIAKSNTIDEVGLKAHLDMSKITYDGKEKKLSGFDEQLKDLQTNQKHLFNQIGGTGHPQGGFEDKNKGYADLRDSLKEHYSEK